MTTRSPFRCRWAAPAGLLLALMTSFAMASPPKHPAMQALLERSFPPDGPGAVVLVQRGDRLLHHSAVGLANLELGTPLQTDSVLRIGSVAKQFAAVLLLRQVAQGNARLDDALERYVPGFPNGEAITLEQLLNHTAGTRSYTDVPGYMDTEARLARSTAELVQRMASERPDFPPGQGWHYSNTGYILVGAVLERITGQAWGVQLQTVFDELGMACTDPGDQSRVVPRLASGYAADGQGRPVPPPPVDLSQAQMAGAAAACANDLLTWNQALHGGRLLPQALYQRMRTPTAVKQPADYGLGLAMTSVRGREALWHGGRLPGYTAMLMTVPEAQLHVVVMRNSDSPEPHVETLAKRLAAIAMGAPFPEALASPPAEPLDPSLVGVYRSGSNGVERQLRWQEGRLLLQRAGYPQQVLHPLEGGGWQIGGSLSRLQRNGTSLHHWPDGDGEPERWVRVGDLPRETPALALNDEQMEALAGDYAGPQFELRVFKSPGQGLMAQAPGQPAVPLEAQSPSRLVVKALGATLDFELSSGKALRVTLLQGPLRLEMSRR